MALLSALATVIVPVLIVAGVGAILGRRFRIDPGVMSKISLHALTPALAAQTVLRTEVSARTGAGIVAAFVLLCLLGALLGRLVTLGSPPATRRAGMVSVAIGNNGNMGLPISLFALGQSGFDLAVVIYLTSVVLTFFVGPLILGSHLGPRSALAGMARLPVLWAMGVALTVRVVGIDVPLGITRGIDLLAAATLPMILLSLGIQLGASGRARLTRPVVAATLARTVLMPLLSIPVGLVLGLHGLPLQSLVLALAMPTAVNALLLTHEYRGDTITVSHVVTATTVLAFGSAAVVTALLPAIGRL